VTQLQAISGIEIKLKKKLEGSAGEMPVQTISGRVTRHGQPVTAGWIGLLKRRHDEDAVNAYMLRGRTVVGLQFVYEKAPLLDAAYTLKVPYQDDNWYIAVEEAGKPLTLIGPLKITLNEKKHLDIACTDGGAIHGRVKNVPAGWEGNLWAVAFTKDAIQAEARVNADGTFSFPQLAPGEYGLKVGHDAYHDWEVPGGFFDLPPSVWLIREDPWQRAKIATVRSGSETSGIELELPALQANDVNN
jgi:hypothetical protein